MKITRRPSADPTGASAPTTAAVTLDAVPLNSIARPALLVSVRDTEETVAALDGGADVIDIKEPRNGPLGRAANAAIEQVLRAVDRRVPVTAAWGELHELKSIAPPRGLAAIKCGLSRLEEFDWIARWERLRATAETDSRLIPVVYADHEAAHAPPAATVVQHLLPLSCDHSFLAIDTFDKHGPGAVELLGAERVRALAAACRDHGQAMILAGRLGPEHMASEIADAADVFAVRGAACAGDRTGRIEQQRVASLAQRVAHARLQRQSSGRDAL